MTSVIRTDAASGASVSRRLDIAYVVLSLTDSLLATGRGPARARLLTKPLLMPTLALRLTGERPSAGRDSCVAAQVLSWGGDIALLRKDRRSFLVGLGLCFSALTAAIWRRFVAGRRLP